jgi:protein-S-isoprenylcysteine O-methyltransferase Ste14
VNWPRVARRIRVPLGFLSAVVYFWLARPTWRSIAAGAAVAFCGLALRALASGHVRKAEELTTTGPYAYTRNPLYLGSLVVTLGFAIAAANLWIGLAMVAIFFFIYIPTIRFEEGFMRRAFPEFDRYSAEVPRWWPRLRAPEQARGDFSAALYRQHREYNALLGAAAILAALIGKMLWLAQ